MRKLFLFPLIAAFSLAACSSPAVKATAENPPQVVSGEDEGPEPTPGPTAENYPILPLSPLPETDPCWAGWVCVTKERLSTFKTLWAISDIHGNYSKFRTLLEKSGLAEIEGGDWEWKPGVTGQLFIVDGDLINKGPSSAEVARAIFRLRDTGVKRGNTVLVLIGNHEAEIMAGDKGHLTPELGMNANINENRMWMRYGTYVTGIVTKKELRRRTRLAAEIRRMYVGARVGDWMFTHSGFIDVPDDEDPKVHAERVNNFLIAQGKNLVETQSVCKDAATDEEWTHCESLWKALLHGDSFLDAHNWWKKKLMHMRRNLDAAGIKTLFFGHDPDAFKARGQISATADGRFVKLDTGMAADQKVQGGRMLKCELKGGTEMDCDQFDTETGLSELAIRLL